MRSTFFFPALFTAIGLLLASCTTAPDNPVPRFVSLEFEAEGINTPIVEGSDTLRVSEVKFLTRRFRIIDQDSLVLQSSDRIEPFLFLYDEELENPFISLDVQLQFDDIAPVETYEMEFGPLQAGDPVLDDDFRGVDETFSLVFKGQINRRSFIYRSGLSFDKTVGFSPAARLTDEQETLQISKALDLVALFTDPEGGFYSPENEEEMQLVEEAFRQELQIQARAISR